MASEDQSEDFRWNKQHSWLVQFTWQAHGGGKNEKRGAKGPGVSLSPPHMLVLSLFESACPHASRMYFPVIF